MACLFKIESLGASAANRSVCCVCNVHTHLSRFLGLTGHHSHHCERITAARARHHAAYWPSGRPPASPNPLLGIAPSEPAATPRAPPRRPRRRLEQSSYEAVAGAYPAVAGDAAGGLSGPALAVVVSVVTTVSNVLFETIAGLLVEFQQNEYYSTKRQNPLLRHHPLRST